MQISSKLLDGKGPVSPNTFAVLFTAPERTPNVVYIPAARERVELADRAGVFLVLSVDAEDATVDVVALEGHAYLLSAVPFSLLRAFTSEPGEA